MRVVLKGLVRRSRDRMSPSPSGRGTPRSARVRARMDKTFRCDCPHPAFGHPLPAGEGACPKTTSRKQRISRLYDVRPRILFCAFLWLIPFLALAQQQQETIALTDFPVPAWPAEGA